ncbi:MAG: UPF0149 family protein [Terricaulis sp.]
MLLDDAIADDDNLAMLDAFLADRVDDDGLMLCDLDGFLTAVAIGPELILPSEWAPLIWGVNAPVFESDDEAQQILGAVMNRYNAILMALAPDPSTYEPILRANDDGELIAKDWAEGFLMGLALRREAWAPMLESDDAITLLPILVLGDESALAQLTADAEDKDLLRSACAEELDQTVIAIDRFWKSRRRAGDNGDRSHSPTRGPKVGRNQPCPCASGRKFKHCCGR